MIVITDSNIIFSALISPNGVVANVFNTKSNIQFYAPSYLFDEVNKHLDRIETISPLTKKELKQMISAFRERISVIDITKIPKKYYLEAYEIVIDVDFDDVFFVALNRYKGYKIWTSDKELIKGVEAKGYKIFITTAELRKSLYKK